MKKLIRWSAISIGFLIAFLGILFLHFYITTEGDHGVEPTLQHNPSLPHFHAGTYSLHLETFGKDSNEVIIVLHGGPGMDFRYLLPLKELAGEFFMIFYDQRGTGLSPRVAASEISMESMRNDLHTILQSHAGGRKVHLFGHSWGALLAADYAFAFPDKVNKMVLAEPWVLPPLHDLPIKESALLWFESLHIKEPDRHAGTDYFLHSLSRYYQDAGQAEMEFWRYGSLARKTLLNDPRFLEGNLHTSYLNSQTDKVDKILYIAGEKHSVPREKHLIDPYEINQEIQRILIKDAEYLFGENIEATLSEIRKFLKE